jgi:hypothetical protein
LEGYLAQVLQSRQNHETFVLHKVEVDAHPDLRERFQIDGHSALIVVADRTVRAKLDHPSTAKHITEFLRPWLR